MVDLSSYKRKSGNTDKLTKQIESLKTTYDSSDNSENIWKPNVDKAGNGEATIRFLPASPADGGPEGPDFVQYYSHGFEGTHGWLIEKCPTTKGLECPVCEANKKLWATNIKANQDIVRERKRKLSYVSNIYVVSDKLHPENNGKVFLYRYGQEVFKKIQQAITPAFEDDPKFDPFDLWEGANFKLRISKGPYGWDYAQCKFDAPSELFSDDAKLNEVLQAEYSIKELVDDSKFKSYEAIEKRLNKVLGVESSAAHEDSGKMDTLSEMVSNSRLARNSVEDDVDGTNSIPTSSKAAPVASDDDELDYFKKLAAED